MPCPRRQRRRTPAYGGRPAKTGSLTKPGAGSRAGCAYAIQAGREVRIIVRPEEIDDLASIALAKSIEESLQYAGQIE